MRSKRKAIQIIWEDSNSHQGWIVGKMASQCDVAICETIGLLVGETKRGYQIALSGGINDDDAGDIIVIPKSCVLKKRFLKRPN